MKSPSSQDVPSMLPALRAFAQTLQRHPRDAEALLACALEEALQQIDVAPLDDVELWLRTLIGEAHQKYDCDQYGLRIRDLQRWGRRVGRYSQTAAQRRGLSQHTKLRFARLTPKW